MRRRSFATAPVVAVDVDGVLLDFDSAWVSCAQEALRRPVVFVRHAWDMARRYGLDAEEAHQVWAAFHKNGWWGRIEPYPYAWELLDALRRLGCDVVAVTNADAPYASERAVTLGGLVDERKIFMLGRSASPDQRVELLKQLHTRAFLDDLPENANAAALYVPASALLYRQYADREEPSDGVTVIDDPLDFAPVLEGMLS